MEASGLETDTNPAPRTFEFEARDDCPACRSKAVETVYSTPFGAGGIGTLMRDYYHVDPAVLSAAPYELRRCSHCGLVYQHYVGGAELLTRLIPNGSTSRRIRSATSTATGPRSRPSRPRATPMS